MHRQSTSFYLELVKLVLNKESKSGTSGYFLDQSIIMLTPLILR